MPYMFNDAYERHAPQAQNEQRSECMQLKDARNAPKTIASIEEALTANTNLRLPMHRSVKVAHSLLYELASGNALLTQRQLSCSTAALNGEGR